MKTPQEKECLNCGLTKASCDLGEKGDEWVQNCIKIKGKKHVFCDCNTGEIIGAKGGCGICNPVFLYPQEKKCKHGNTSEQCLVCDKVR